MSKTILITGASQGIGLAAAHKLAAQGHALVLAARRAAALEAAAQAICAAAPGARVETLTLDLAAPADVRRFAAGYLASGRPLHVLLNNAGRMVAGEAPHLTPEGVEQTWATNVLGPFLLTSLLLPRLKESAPARIVFVGSRTHLPNTGGGVGVDFDFDDAQTLARWEGQRAYKNSKLAVQWLTYAFARRLEGSGVDVLSVCPGFVPATISAHVDGLFRRLFYRYVLQRMPFAATLDDAAEALADAAAGAEWEGRSGLFLVDGQAVRSSDDSYDADKQERLWALAAQMVGMDSENPGQ